MIGTFIIKKFKNAREVQAVSDMNNDIAVSLYLPPLNRQNTSDIATGDKVFGVVDDVSGVGAVLFAIDHDFANRFDYDLAVKGKITASGDVKAGTVSVQAHIHAAELTVEGTAEAGVVSGAATGNTNKPTA